MWISFYFRKIRKNSVLCLLKKLYYFDSKFIQKCVIKNTAKL